MKENNKYFIQTFPSSSLENKMSIHDFKTLVIEDLISFVNTQDTNLRLEDDEWAEKYSEYLVKEEN